MNPNLTGKAGADNILNNIDLTLSIQEIQAICPMPRHTATDLCKRFGFIVSGTWCISEAVLRRLMKAGIAKAMRLSPGEATRNTTQWRDPLSFPPPKYEEIIVLTAAGERKIIKYIHRKKLRYPIRYYMPAPELPCEACELI